MSLWSAETTSTVATVHHPPVTVHVWRNFPINSFLLFQLNDFELRKGKKLGVTISFNNHRLFVGNIPKNRDRDELLEEFTKHAREYRCAICQRCIGQNFAAFHVNVLLFVQNILTVYVRLQIPVL